MQKIYEIHRGKCHNVDQKNVSFGLQLVQSIFHEFVTQQPHCWMTMATLCKQYCSPRTSTSQ
jgi:hypothetical protein